MLDDENKMNHLNPFVTNGPGAWSNPYPLGAPSAPTPASAFVGGPSPLCLSNITAGADECFDSPSVCPMKRSVEPERNIDPDVGTGFLDALYGNFVIPSVSVAPFSAKRSSWHWWVLILLIALFFAFRRRTS